MRNAHVVIIGAGIFGASVACHQAARGQLIAEEILDGRAQPLDIDELRVARCAGAGLRPERNVD